MKVCFITSVFPRHENDPAPWLVETVNRLQQKGVDMSVFCPSFKGLRDQMIHNVKVRRFRYFFKNREDLTHDEGAPNKIRNPLYLFIAFFYVLFGLIHIIRYCRKERFDILHVQWPFPHGIWGYAGAKVCKAKIILSFHGAELLLIKKYPFVKYFLKHAITHSDRITANSSFTRDKILKIKKTDVDVVGFGSTVQERKYKKKINLKKQILFAGRIIERKGLDFLIKAMPEITSQIRSELIIVGEGHQREKMEQLVRGMRLEKVVKFLGKISNEELNKRYQECDVFVLPAIVDSRGDTEGLGVVLIEALTYKKPVVASQVGGIVDIIKHRKTGLLMPEKDPSALASSVIEVLKDNELAKQLGENGYRYIKENFTWEKTTNRLVNIYSAVMSQSSYRHNREENA